MVGLVEWSVLNANVLDFRYVFALSNYVEWPGVDPKGHDLALDRESDALTINTPPRHTISNVNRRGLTVRPHRPYIIIIIIIKNEKIRVTLCENAAGALYIVNKMCVDGLRNVEGEAVRENVTYVYAIDYHQLSRLQQVSDRPTRLRTIAVVSNYVALSNDEQCWWNMVESRSKQNCNPWMCDVLLFNDFTKVPTHTHSSDSSL